MFNIDQYEILKSADALMDNVEYKKRIDGVAKVQTDLMDHEAAAMAIWMNNTEKACNRYARAKNLSDATYSEVVGPYIKHALNIVSVLYSTFELKDMISIQPLTQKIGALYYLNYLYGSDKGDISVGDAIFGPKLTPVRKGNYSSQKVVSESGTWATSGGDAVLPFAYYPISTYLTHETEIVIVVAGTGNLVGTYTYFSMTGSTIINLQIDASGTSDAQLDIATGVLNVSGESAAVAAVTGSTATYYWNSEKYTNKSFIPRITVRVDETEIRATRRQLLIDVMLDTTFDYESQFGRNLNAEMEAGVIQEIQNETAYEVLENMQTGADGNQGETFTFDVTPLSPITLTEHAQRYAKHLADQSTRLFKNYGRGRGNFIATGSDLFNFFESMPDNIWAPSGQNDGSARGPYFAGTFMKKWKVYYNPAYTDNTYITGFKGKDWWESPYYIGSYLPLMATKFMMFPDLHGEQGYISMDAHDFSFPKHVINATVTES